MPTSPAERILHNNAGQFRSGLFAVSLATLMLAGCGGPTLYQPADPDFGYREQQIEQDRYRVTFAGNSLTDRDTVENYLLYRAAELTLEHGFDYFVVFDRDLEAKTRYVYSFSAFPGYGHYRLYGFRRHFGYGVPADGQAWPRTRYEAVANIVLFPGKPAVEDVKAFSASEVLRYLDSQVIRSKETTAAAGTE